jgi:hypothetical protein
VSEPQSVPNGNALFLVCRTCSDRNEAEFGVRLAERTLVGWYDPVVPPKQFKNWLAKHAKCGGRGNPDHFQLAMLFTANHDQGKLMARPELKVVS